MCLSKAYVDRNGNRELLIEEVAFVKVEGEKLLLRTLFGEQKEIGANIREIDFLSHSIVLGNLKEEGVSPKDERLS
ncbi:MAG: CooT family nickel-binding protein [Dehalococcoidales bacterium]|jgi:predicted RNA-binding protein